MAESTVSNLQYEGFNDRALSAMVRDGQWEVCSDAYFRGKCVTLNCQFIEDWSFAERRA